LNIIGKRGRRRYRNHYFIDPIITCKNPSFDSPIEMLIDTGATRSSMSYNDALKFDIDVSSLQYGGRFHGIGGTCNYFLTGRVQFAFELPKNKYHFRRLKNLTIMKPQLETECCPKCNHEWTPGNIKHCPKCGCSWIPRNDKLREIALRIPSILGMDILKRYNIRFTEKRVYLEF